MPRLDTFRLFPRHKKLSLSDDVKSEAFRTMLAKKKIKINSNTPLVDDVNSLVSLCSMWNACNALLLPPVSEK